MINTNIATRMQELIEKVKIVSSALGCRTNHLASVRIDFVLVCLLLLLF